MIFQFEDFELDESQFELRRAGETIAVPLKALELMICLVRDRHRLVTRDELCDGPWRGAVVSDSAISQVVKQARRALGDDADKPRLIRTVRGKGFRFVGIVSEIASTRCISSDQAWMVRSAAFGRAVAAAKAPYRNAHKVCQSVFALIHQIVGMRVCVLTRIDLETNQCTVVQAYDAAGLDIASGMVFPADSTVCARVFRGACPIRERDLEARPALRQLPFRTRFGLHSYIGVPLWGGNGRIWGTLAATDTNVRETTDHHVETLTVLGHLAVREFDCKGPMRA
ncbi:MAG: winged helix-turn-helix domain-containing protein [Polyangiaceae bacterium]|nr:winged helix-turn-helix domain-containing protein [Polyangiaceae bacterium]